MLDAWAKAAGASRPIDSTCLTKAETKFGFAFAKAELRSGCAQTGDASPVESAVDSCVSNIVGLLPPPTPSTGPTTPTLPSCGAAEPGSLAGITAAQNAVRANASPPPSPPLDPFRWSTAAAANPQTWAAGCGYRTNPTSGSLCRGQNTGAETMSGPPRRGETPPIDSVDSWAAEAAAYDYATN